MQEDLAPDIISHYTMHGATAAEVVKYMIVNISKKDKDVSNIFLKALILVTQQYFYIFFAANY